ncbi:MAG: glycosyltransferase family 39 protein [Chloroflexi bacterium]|nr:glycosyltransferase family 39 protein [Chloroflexota bacterium]
MIRRLWSPSVILALALALGLGLRLYHVTVPPLEFHPLRQLKGAITARYLYYRWNPDADPERRERAAALYRRIEQLEPPVLDALVAGTYLLLGREAPWVARIYSMAFWALGVVGLYKLGRELVTASPWAALAGPLYLLFLPFAVMASRTFQPDPLMVALLIWSAWAWHRWAQRGTWADAWRAGLLSGATIFVKAYAAFPLAGIAGAMTWLREGPAFWRRKQVWLMAGLAALPVLAYYGWMQGLLGSYPRKWTAPMVVFWRDPMFYGRWLHTVVKYLGGAWLLGAVVGWALSARRAASALLAGWAVGYGVYGMLVPYQSMTHNYYHLPLLPWIGLGLTLLADGVLQLLRGRERWRYALVGLAVTAAVVYASAESVRQLNHKVRDYRAEPAFWQTLVSMLPEGKYIGLVQDFGMRMNYFGWRGIAIWPTAASLELAKIRGNEQDMWTRFRERTAGYDYFLVTAMGQWQQQPALREILTRYYPIVLQGDGYIVFDLRHPKEPLPNPDKEDASTDEAPKTQP